MSRGAWIAFALLLVLTAAAAVFAYSQTQQLDLTRDLLATANFESAGQRTAR